MPSSPEDKIAAELIKGEGNALFKRGRYAAAADKYTEAIAIAGDVATLYANRALCHRKLERWPACESDARVALSLSSGHMKASYQLGLALRHQLRHGESVIALERALDAARASGDSIKDEIWRELAACKLAQWEQASTVRRDKRERLQARLADMIELYYKQNKTDTSRRRDEADLAEIFRIAAARDAGGEADGAYTCTLTMEPFRDPVCTPDGNSYERAALLDHLRKVGAFDPVSRSPLSVQQLVPNYKLRVATQQYLDTHEWCWAECVNPSY